VIGRQLPLELTRPAEPTLENFVVGANGELLERLRAAAAGRAGETVLYLWGEAGSGRSHLLRAAAAAAGGVYLTPESDFARAGGRLVAADDVERLDPARQIALFGLINRARETGTPVLAAAGAPPAQLALREDLRSRLGWGLVYRVQPLGDADKARHLHAEAERRGMRLPDEVSSYLLQRLPRDLPTLNALLDALDRASLAERRPITLPLLRALLRDAAD